MEIKPIRMTINAGLDQTEDSSGPLEEHFRVALEVLQAVSGERLAGGERGVVRPGGGGGELGRGRTEVARRPGA